jgi:hypothetical protein
MSGAPVNPTIMQASAARRSRAVRRPSESSNERLQLGANEERVSGEPFNLAIMQGSAARRGAVQNERMKRGANEERVSGAHK